MAKFVKVEISGYITLSADTLFDYYGICEGFKDQITAAEWLELSADKRNGYVLSSLTDAYRDAEDSYIDTDYEETDEDL